MFGPCQRPPLGLPPLKGPSIVRLRQSATPFRGPLRLRHSRDCCKHGACEYCWNFDNPTNSFMDETSAGLTDSPFTDDDTSDTSLSSCLDYELPSNVGMKVDVPPPPSTSQRSGDSPERMRHPSSSLKATQAPNRTADANKRVSAPLAVISRDNNGDDDDDDEYIVTRRTIYRRRINTNSNAQHPPTNARSTLTKESCYIGSRSHLSGRQRALGELVPNRHTAPNKRLPLLAFLRKKVEYFSCLALKILGSSQAYRSEQWVQPMSRAANQHGITETGDYQVSRPWTRVGESSLSGARACVQELTSRVRHSLPTYGCIFFPIWRENVSHLWACRQVVLWRFA